MVATPGYVLVHDALDYDKAAGSIASGDGWPYSRAPGAGDRVPPAGLPGAAGRRLQGRGRRARPKHDRVVPARILGIIIGTLIVAMIGMVAAQLWGRRVALLAMAGGASTYR